MHGNRDFMLAERYAARAGMQLIADPCVIDLYGTRTLLMHGDTLCVDDLAYQRFRRRVRRPMVIRLLRALPFALRNWLAGRARAGSESAKSAKSADIMDVNTAAVAYSLRAHGVCRLIHGHTHRPARHDHAIDGQTCERWVLPDWYARWGYVVCDAQGCTLAVAPL